MNTAVLEGGRSAAEGSFRISFEKLFDRRPRPGTAEKDIVLSTRDIGGVALVVWLEMGFIQPIAISIILSLEYWHSHTTSRTRVLEL